MQSCVNFVVIPTDFDESSSEFPEHVITFVLSCANFENSQILTDRVRKLATNLAIFTVRGIPGRKRLCRRGHAPQVDLRQLHVLGACEVHQRDFGPARPGLAPELNLDLRSNIGSKMSENSPNEMTE